MIPRNKMIQIAAIAWVVAVSAYFFYDLYQGIRYGLYQNGVNQGYASAANELISKVSGKCDAPTPITVGDKKLEIVDVTCLKAPADQSNQSNGAGSPTGPTGPAPSATPSVK
jgi:hypothetical protein